MVKPRGILTGPFNAGFVDADGCLYLQDSGRKVITVLQQHRSVCDALQSAWRGRVNTRSSKHGDVLIWTLTRRRDVQIFEEAGFPFLAKNWEQGQIILERSAASAAEDRDRLSKLKGRRSLLREEDEDDEDDEIDLVRDEDDRMLLPRVRYESFELSFLCLDEVFHIFVWTRSPVTLQTEKKETAQLRTPIPNPVILQESQRLFALPNRKTRHLRKATRGGMS